MQYYVIIDTNVLVSSFLKEESNPHTIVQRAICGEYRPILNDEILKEYFDVLCRKKFKLDKKDINNTLISLLKNAIYVDKKPTSEVLIDKTDVVFYETLENARELCDAYLVTGNMKHFPKKPYIVTPRDMLELLEDCYIIV